MLVDIIDTDLKRITFNDGREIIMNNDEIDSLCKDSDYVEKLEIELHELQKNKQVFEQVQKLVSKMNEYINEN